MGCKGKQEIHYTYEQNTPCSVHQLYFSIYRVILGGDAGGGIAIAKTSFLCRFLLPLPHGSSSTSTASQFRSARWMVSGLVTLVFRLAVPMTMSCLHGLYEIPPELLGNPVVVGLHLVILMLCFRPVVYFD